MENVKQFLGIIVTDNHERVKLVHEISNEKLSLESSISDVARLRSWTRRLPILSKTARIFSITRFRLGPQLQLYEYALAVDSRADPAGRDKCNLSVITTNNAHIPTCPIAENVHFLEKSPLEAKLLQTIHLLPPLSLSLFSFFFPPQQSISLFRSSTRDNALR